MDRRTLGACFQFVLLAGIFCALCLGFERAEAATISVAPMWEAVNPASKSWSTYGAEIIEQFGDDLLHGSEDIETFCPKYNQLNHDDRVTAWLYIVSTIVKYESNFSPTDRYEEKGMGVDPITGQSIWSEGLLQLSYQDVLKFPFCDEFQWDKDKLLSPNDPKKTILSPFKNLKCGIQILNYQIHKHDKIAIDDDAYWAVIMPRNVHNRLAKIRALVSAISICQ